MSEGLTLSDLGERRIISEILASRYGGLARGFGDDCAHVDFGTFQVVATTDPCPPPMAEMLGYTDPYYRGWLLATINLSDIAASGAAPLGLLTSLVLPREFGVSDFERLLDGIDECCASVGTSVLGGNIKEGSALDIQATALGSARAPVMRSGASLGDEVLLIGPLAEFWAFVLSTRSGVALEEPLASRARSGVLTPRPQVRLGQALAASGLVTSMMDNSDGLGPSLEAVGTANNAGIEVEIEVGHLSTDVLHAAERIGVDPRRLLFGWGDWQLVVTAAADAVDEVLALAADLGEDAMRIGRLVRGTGVWVDSGSSRVVLEAPDSQRFADDSWFTVGIEEYIRRLRSFDLPGVA